MTQVPVFETLFHPPLGLLKRELIGSLFTGSGTIDRPSTLPPPFNHVNAYGLTWDIITLPAGYGVTLGTPNVYENRIVQLGTVHLGSDSHALISEWHEFTVEGAYWLWSNPGPLHVTYEIGVGVELALFGLSSLDMPRGMRYAIYVADDATEYARLVDADQVLEAERGWSTAGVAGKPLLPLRAKPRVVYGVSATSGRRGSAVVATTTADLWTGTATTFVVEANDGSDDTMTVTRRRGESFAQAH